MFSIYIIYLTYELTHTCKSSVSFSTLLLTSLNSLDAILEMLQYNQMKLDYTDVNVLIGPFHSVKRELKDDRFFNSVLVLSEVGKVLRH